jgi:hypothetical protein
MTDWSPELLIGAYAIGATLIVIGAGCGGHDDGTPATR